MINKSNFTYFLSFNWFLFCGGLICFNFLLDLIFNIPGLATIGLVSAIFPTIMVVLILAYFLFADIFNLFAKKIYHTCPRCSSQEPPFYICPDCHQNIKGLRPSIYGVFQAQCDHCGYYLPTTDNGGRGTLKKVCSECKSDMIHSQLGKQSEYRFGIAGARSSGKTTLMTSAIAALKEEFGHENGIDISFGCSEEEREFKLKNQLLEKGRVLDQTARSFPKALTISLTSENGINSLIYIYDAAGEDFTEDEDRLEKHPIHLYDGILLVVDPFGESGVRAGLVGKLDSEEINSNRPAEVNAAEVAGRLINVLERVLKVGVGKKIPLPLAIVTTKIDAFDSLSSIKRNPFGGWYYSLTAAANDAEYYSLKIRDFLQKAELGNFIRLVESRFARVGYFGVSSLGRTDDAYSGSAFKSFGVSAPFVWLCYYSGSLTDNDSWERAFANAHINFFRSLRGTEGPKLAKLSRWIFFIFILLSIFIVTLIILIMPPLLFALSVGIPVLGLLILYGWLFTVLVLQRFL